MSNKKIFAHFEGYITEIFDDTFGFQAYNKIDDTENYLEIIKTSIRAFDQNNIVPGKGLSWIIWKQSKDVSSEAWEEDVRSVFKFHKIKPFTKEEIKEMKIRAEELYKELNWKL